MEEIYKHQVENYKTIFYEDKTEVEDREFRSYEMIPVYDGDEPVKFLFKDKPYKPKRLDFKKKYETSDKEKYVENYGNLLAAVTKKYGMILVERDETKVSIKIFSGSRIRRAGSPHFRVRKNLAYLTLNKKTGDVYHGILRNYNLKKKFSKSISRNSFFSNFSQFLHQEVHTYVHDSVEMLIEAMNLFVSDFSEVKDNVKTILHKNLLEYYLKKKNVKYPNNFLVFWKDYDFKVPLPIIRKNGNKFIDAFMDKNELSGTVIKKALHEVDKINLYILKLALAMFPNQWVYQDYNFIKDCLQFGGPNSNPVGLGILDREGDLDDMGMSTSEKRRAFELFKNQVLTNQIMFWSYFDHFRFYEELKYLGENIKWMAKDKKSFQDEHLEFSDRLDYYKKGHYYRIYPKYMYDLLQEPFTIKNETYYPVLLDDSANYNGESLIQSNCVKNYVGTSGAIIISLRRQSIDSDIRSTIEFRIANRPNENISFTVPQALGKFNSRLTEDWDEPLEFLKKRFFKCIRDKRFETVKLKKVFKNGKELSSDSSWDDYGNLRWDSVDITKYY